MQMISELLFKKNQTDDLSCNQIADNLFTYIEQDGSFFYNEKENKIDYIDNIYNCIIKCFPNNEKSDLYNKEKIKNFYLNNDMFHLYYLNNQKSNLYNSKKIKYFYLTNDMFAIFDGNYYLYIVNLSKENNSVQKIQLNWIKDKYIFPEIKDLIYSKVGQNEYLYISFKAQDKKTENVINLIVNGIIN
jgi:hypothetical protein